MAVPLRVDFDARVTRAGVKDEFLLAATAQNLRRLARLRPAMRPRSSDVIFERRAHVAHAAP